MIPASCGHRTVYLHHFHGYLLPVLWLVVHGNNIVDNFTYQLSVLISSTVLISEGGYKINNNAF